MPLTTPTQTYTPYGSAGTPVPALTGPSTIEGFGTKTYHATSIIVGSTIIGRISSWQVDAFSRQAVHVREVSRATWGRPVDLVPGISEGYKITFDRAEVWGAELELALGLASGTATWADLAEQDTPFIIKEELYRGIVPYSMWEYHGCWITSRNESARTAEGDGIIKVEGGEIMYVRRIKVG